MNFMRGEVKKELYKYIYIYVYNIHISLEIFNWKLSFEKQYVGYNK